MTDPLSLAASSFAVIGVADVALRAGVGARRFLSDIKDAPAEVERLRKCVAENTRLVEDSKQCLEWLGSDPCSISPSASVIELSGTVDLLRSTIRSLGRELDLLAKLVQKHGGTNKSWGKVRWVLDDRTIQKSIQRLEASKTTLNTVLSLLGRRQAALGQKSVENVLQDKFQQLATKLDTHQQNLVLANERQEKIVVWQQDQVVHLRGNILANRKNTQMEHSLTRQQISKGNAEVINTICFKVDDLSKSLISTPATVRKSNREITFIGENRENFLTPLLLIKDHVRRSILEVLSNSSHRVSPHYLYWLQSEFNNLVSSATQEVAALSKSSTATSFDQWTYCQGSSSCPGKEPQANTLSKLQNRKTRDKAEAQREGSNPTNPQGSKRFHSDWEEFTFHSQIGSLRIGVPRSDKASPTNPITEEVSFCFIPSADICQTSIATRFVKSAQLESESKLYAQINAYRLVEDINAHLDIYCFGTIADIDDAFRSGIISPYDIDKEGTVLCHMYAACLGRLELFHYFDNQGLGLSALNNGEGALIGFWRSIDIFNEKTKYEDNLVRLLSYFDEKMVALFPSEPLLDAVMWRGFSFEGCERSQISLIRRWIKFLQADGYEIERKDQYGWTALLDHLACGGGTSLEVVRLLIEFGASIHETDNFGRNALQCTMFSGLIGKELRGLLEEKLSILIGLGVDIHHRNRWGSTPSHSALIQYECWHEWCRALQRNGKDIRDVVHRDGEPWLLAEAASREPRLEEIDDEQSDWETIGSDNSDAEDDNIEGKDMKKHHSQWYGASQ